MILVASFDMPWYVWAWFIILFIYGWPTLLPSSMLEPPQEDLKVARKHGIKLPGHCYLSVEAVGDSKVRRREREEHQRVFNRLKKGETIAEGDPDYKFLQHLKSYYKHGEETN
jgi:hypothetical protein